MTSIQTTYTRARANLARLCDEVVANQEVAIIRRRGQDPVALIPAAELSSLLETAHLLRSPANAQRLLRAIQRAQDGEGEPESVEQLRQSLGLD